MPPNLAGDFPSIATGGCTGGAGVSTTNWTGFPRIIRMGREGENGVPFPFSSPGGLACIPLEWPHPGTCHTWKMKAEPLEADAWDRAVLRFCFRTWVSGLSHGPCVPVEGGQASVLWKRNSVMNLKRMMLGESGPTKKKKSACGVMPFT